MPQLIGATSGQHSDDRRDILVLSDFHMSLGREPGAPVGYAHEEFRQDAAFARFLDHLIVRGADRFHLVLLGDLVDFLTADPAVGGGASAALAKLERIVAGHPAPFSVLGAFAVAGGRLTIVPGNHDVELLRPSVRRRLVELMVRNGDPSAPARVGFAPWIFHVPGVLYAEHGSQYHDINAFPTLLSAADGDDIELPLGSQLALRALRRREHGQSKAHDAAFALSAARTAAALGGPAERRRRAVYRAAVLAAAARDTGLRPETLTAIDRLSERSALALGRRALRLAARRRANGSHGITDPPAPDTVDDAILRAARAVDGVLAREGSAVPFYAFGHTHRAAQLPLREGERPAWYFNTGAWADGAAPPPFLPYLHIERNGVPTARLLAWNDAERVPAPLAPWVRATAARPRPPAEDRSETALAPR